MTRDEEVVPGVARGRAVEEAQWRAFASSPSVLRSRERGEFIDCPICRARDEEYLFHDGSGRHVQCRRCGFVFVNPIPTEAPSAQTLSADLLTRLPVKRVLYVAEVRELIERSAARFQQARGRQLGRVVLLGALTAEVTAACDSGELPAEALALSDSQTASLLWHGDAECIRERLVEVDLLVLLELLDHSLRPDRALEGIVRAATEGAWIAIVYRDNTSAAARLLRRWWRGFASGRTSFFSRENVAQLARGAGAWPRFGFEVWARQTASTALHRFSDRLGQIGWIRALDNLRFKIPVGRSVTLIEVQHQAREMLSIVVPVFNERRYAKQVLEALVQLELPIEREIVIVESNSSDGTRDIVRQFEDRPGVKIIYEERPRGKGHAVRQALQAVSGSIVLIQDADFEYDLEDYLPLLRPILTRRAEFVLGSRTLGLGGWKVRRYRQTPVKAWLLNIAQVIFAGTYNLLYRQNTTDIVTMFKVFRRSCLTHFNLTSNGFELDIELACKLAKAGFAPYEVPVNYRARGFEEGKKVRFFRDGYHAYMMLYRCRFGKD